MKKEIEKLLKELSDFVIYGEEKIKEAYKKEKIVPVDNKIANINKIYKECRKIEEDNYWKMRHEEIFYLQAKFMEEFVYEDEKIKEYNLGRDNFSRSSTYSGMKFNEFKMYFAWRTKIRNGIFCEISRGYEQIYINELLNKIGVKDADEAIDKLIEFWIGYSKYLEYVNKIMPNVIKEFFITNIVNKSYDEIIEKYPIKIRRNSKDIKEIMQGVYKDKLEFFNEISTYKIVKSKFLETKYGYLLNECLESVFKKLENELKAKYIYLREMLVIENKDEQYWRPLAFYDIYELDKKNKKVEIDGIEKYERKDGIWSRTICKENFRYRHFVGYILKLTESYVRDYLGYRSLKMPDANEILKDLYEGIWSYEDKELTKTIYKMELSKIVETEVLKHLEETKIPKMACKKKKIENEEEKEEKVEIVFNQEKFDEIRKKSEEIQSKLIIEEEQNKIEEKPIEQIQTEEKDFKEIKQEKNENKARLEENFNESNTLKKNTEENMFKLFVNSLSETEKEIIKILLEKQDVEKRIFEVAKKQNEMLEVVISNINDKALETIGDTLVEADMKSIYEDYENEINKVL